MRRLTAITATILLTASHATLGWGAEGFDRTAKPHAGTVRDAGSTPAASTTRQTADLILHKPRAAKSAQHPSQIRTDRASRSYRRTPTYARALTQQLARKAGHGFRQRACLTRLWTRESNFRPNAHNRHSGAGGIPQILGLDPRTPTRQQIKRGLHYIHHRYHTPCRAWAFHVKHGWY